MTPAPILATLYLDEDVSVLLADLLRSHGVDALTARDARTLGESDSFQLTFAISHGRVLLTHNRVDFELLHSKALDERRSHAGIVIANRRASTADLARRVMKLLNLVTAEEMKDQLRYI